MHNNSTSKHFLSVALVVMLTAILSVSSMVTVSAATALKVTPAATGIHVGKTTTLKSNQKVKWSVVKGKSYIKITSKNGKTLKIKGIKKGTAYINAVAGNKSQKVKVAVYTKAPKKITLTSSAKKRVGGDLGVGTTCKVSVKSVSPTSACKAVAFSSSDKRIATVNGDGVVTGIGAGDVVITAKSLANSKVKKSIKLRVVNTISGTMTTTVDMSDEERFPAGKVTKVWFPVPQTDDNQIITDIKYDANGTVTHAITSMKKDSAGNLLWFIEWPAETRPQDRVAKLTYHVERWEIECDDDMAAREKGQVDKEAFATYLDIKDLSPEVKSLADKIVADANATTVYEKAYAIYEWMADNLYTKSGTPSATVNDVDDLLFNTKTAGGCACISYAYTLMCRAEGIPARVVYGVKLDKNSNRCHTDFYLPGYGWVPADANDAIRKIEGNEDAYRGPEASDENKEAWMKWKRKYFGYAYAAPFLKIAEGVDITLNPAISVTDSDDDMVVGGKLRELDWPYGEYDGQYAIRKADRGTLYIHKFSEGVDDDDDCGC